jgi:enoyl-CoA hydratase
MTYETLQVAQEGNALMLQLNRPNALNALNQQMMRELHHFFTEGYKAFSGMKGVVLTGAGERAFAAGADIKEFLGLDASGGRDMAAFGHQVFFAIERFHLPVIAAINGFALGGGCELAMSCHIRIASEKAKFGQPEVNLGLIPGYGGTQRLTQLIGKSRAMHLMLTADMITAAQAEAYGLVSKVCAPEQLMEEAKNLINTLAAKAPIALAKVIASVNAVFEDGQDGFTVEVEAFGQCTATTDFKEGAAAFVEKRAAQFKGE